jgi:spermidine/putrescine transport system substrate-binding protein
MTERYDGSSIDLEKALVRYMVERRITRREVLERMALVGSAAALAPIIAACTTSGGATQSAAAPASASEPPSAPPTPSPSPTPVPSPEGELNILNWTDYLADDVIKSFEAKYKVKVTQSFFATTDEMYAKLGDDGGDYDISFPISVDVPNMIAKGTIAKLDKSLLTNIGNLGAEWANPGYDPDNTYTVPYMWWTTGVGYDPARITGDAPTSSKALWDERWKQHISMLDDWQEVFGLTLIQMGTSANTDNTADLDAALALLEKQKPLVRTYSTDTIGTMTSGDIWIGHIWGADRFAIQETIPDFAYYIPEEGGVKGSDTVATFTGSPHPIASQLFINHLLDAQNSAANTNLIYYMGPNAAAKEFIDPAILEDPTINPDQEIVDKLEELLALEQSVRDEYLKRWQELRG